jgi:hypothetical protein
MLQYQRLQQTATNCNKRLSGPPHPRREYREICRDNSILPIFNYCIL